MKKNMKVLGPIWLIVYLLIIISAVTIFIRYPQKKNIVTLVWTWIITMPLAVNFIVCYIIGKDKKDILDNDYRYGLTGIILFIFLTFVLIRIIVKEFYAK
ncbi:MAG TPA: hypothetical protein PLJ39_10015 [Spirochaetota bacterium]|nr:hypothetical protein [Spirochaetota bacterium]